MIVPDVNLLLYAQITGFAEHPKAWRWWEGLLDGDTEVAIATPALFGFIRLATSPRVFDRPLEVTDAIQRVEDWLARPHVRFALRGSRHLEVAFGLLRDLGAAGSLTTDVQLAALAIEHQGEVHSNASDFGRFRQLRWINPLR